MPTRILYWNIRDFARNKIDDPAAKKRKKGSTLNRTQASQDRLLHILWLINRVNPDIIVVVEVETAFDAKGRLVRGNGMLGATTLYSELRNNTNNVNWRLIPPIQTGPNEGVAVFYLSRRPGTVKRYFTGPYVWPGGANATAQAGGGTGAYPPALASLLPLRVIPNDALYNGGTSERLVAARVTGYTEAAHMMNAGAAVNYNAQRSPYMTTFSEYDNNDNLIRHLTLFAVHSPASGAATAYLTGLGNVAQIVDNLDNDEVRVLVGDFNVNLMTAAHAQTGAYNNNLQAQGNYALALTPLGAPPAPLQGYEGYYATHVRSTATAAIWSTNTDQRWYPGYGYIGSEIVTNLYAIDNIYTVYGANLAAPGNNNLTIMNPISGVPYNAFAAPAVGVPIGSIAAPIEMQVAPVYANPANAFNLGVRTSFIGWEQYGHIYSVSDHLALAIDV